MPDFEIPMNMIYPTFLVIPSKGIIPNINLPQNYKELVKEFYKYKGKEEVERYKEGLVDLLKNDGKPIDIGLAWNDENGLINISVGVHGGLDLDDSILPKFQEHNLGGTNGMYAAAIATKYVYELLKLSE